MVAGKHRKRKANSGENVSSTRPDVAAAARLGWWPLLSAITLWAAFPPVGFSLLAWIAPLGWLHCVEKHPTLDRRAYGSLWISGCVFWLLILQGVRLAYWPLYLGWIAISLYLALYIPLFVAGTRLLRQRWRFPLVLAAPIAWVGLELFRGYFLTGFCANTLAHTQVQHLRIIQIADQFGGYGISYLLMSICAGLYQAVQCWRAAAPRQNGYSILIAWPLGLALLLLAATLVYGQWRLSEADRLYASRSPLMRVLLIQENTPTMFESDMQSLKSAWMRYLETTRSEAEKHSNIDLLVWPESTFSAGSPWIDPQLPDTLPEQQPELSEQEQREIVEENVTKAGSNFEIKIGLLLAAATGREYALGVPLPADGPHLLLGSDAMVVNSQEVEMYNSALWMGSDGALIDRYDKMHIVMFGEYIPLGPVLQWLRDLFNFPGLDAGKQPKCFSLGEVNIAPSICFESMMPRFISWQVRELVRMGAAPDVLINITNDSWFRGSSILDHHLACSVLCAVENRRPLLVGANTGITAEIDGAGRVLQATERFSIGGILASPKRDSRMGLVQTMGYPFAWLCLAILALAVLSSAASSSTLRRFFRIQGSA